jgi:hypothetical protein
MSDGAIARRCGVSRPSVISGMRQLLAIGLVEKVGLPAESGSGLSDMPPYVRNCIRASGYLGEHGGVETRGNVHAFVRKLASSVQPVDSGRDLPWLQG